MRIKPKTKNGGVMVELGPEEIQLPAASGSPMFKVERILVPLDFSECSKKALQYAIPFAKQFNAEITLLYVVEPYPAVPEMAPVDFESLQDGKAELKAVSQVVARDVRCKTSLRTGSPHLEIAAAAHQMQADLIIISTHGHTGLTRVVLGSTTERVVRHAPCPVLIVRESEHDFVPGPAACGDV